MNKMARDISQKLTKETKKESGMWRDEFRGKRGGGRKLCQYLGLTAFRLFGQRNPRLLSEAGA